MTTSVFSNSLKQFTSPGTGLGIVKSLSLALLLTGGQPIAFAENDLGQDYIKIKEVDTAMRPFRLREVKLLDGPIKDETDAQYSFLLNGPDPELRHSIGWTFSSDQILYSFLRNAGLPSKGKGLGQQEADNMPLRGMFTADLLTGMARMYAITGDEKLKQRVDEIVAGLGRAQEALNDDGYLSGFPVSVIANLEKGITQWAFVSFSN